MIKVKVEFEVEDEQVKEIFESYDLKFTKKKLADLKRSLKEDEHDFTYELEDEFENFLGNIIAELFSE